MQLCDGAQSVKVGILLTAGKSRGWEKKKSLGFGLNGSFLSETDTDSVAISPGGHGVDYKPAENQVNVCIGSHSTSGLLKGLVAVFPIRNSNLSPLTESQQSATRRYEAAGPHLQL